MGLKGLICFRKHKSDIDVRYTVHSLYKFQQLEIQLWFSALDDCVFTLYLDDEII